MIKLTFPQPAFRIKEEEGKELIFDDIRKQWVRLTPEEWVRQNFVQYLLQELHYPAAYISIEKEIKLGELKKRFDLLVFDSMHKPWLMLECKAMDVDLTQQTVEQIVRYNMSVPVSFLVVTNGSYTYAWQKTADAFESIHQLPAFKQ